jgi:hypothetical protein
VSRCAAAGPQSQVFVLTALQETLDTGSNVERDVVGRDEQLTRVDRFIDDLAGHPGSLVIEGQPGIGKTTIWRAAVAAAVERDYHVLVSRPSEAETALAYSGLADLLAAVQRTHIEALPDPQRHAIDVALLISEPAGRSPERRTIFAAFGGVLRSLSRDRPVLVAVDDQQWLDKSSSSALEYVWPSARARADWDPGHGATRGGPRCGAVGVTGCGGAAARTVESRRAASTGQRASRDQLAAADAPALASDG